MTKARSKVRSEATAELASPDLVLTSPEGREVHFKDRSDFVSEALRQIEFWRPSMPSMPSGRAIRWPLESSGSGLSRAIRQRVSLPKP